jgi:type II secretory pathway pseudopilin PulG
MRKSIKAFTLVEMLIVMGIIIILMAVGIASGRFAIRRANKIEHQNAAENIYQALQSYYSDNRAFPGDAPDEDPDIATVVTGDLLEYIDDFDGGSDASYTYNIDDADTGQEVIVCVTLGGVQDENQLGIYCTGNGIGSDMITGAPTVKNIEYGTPEYQQVADNLFEDCSGWEAKEGWVDDACDIVDSTPPVPL